MTVAEIKAFLKENADNDEVKSFVAEFAKPINADTVGKWIETDEGKKWDQPRQDKRVSDALKTYREGHYSAEVKKAVDEEIQRLNPKETPEQKQIRELVEKDRKRDAEFAKERRDRQALEILTSEGLPPWYVELIPGSTMEEMKTAIAKIKTDMSERETKIRNELLTGVGFKPGGGNGGAPRADVSKMSKEELLKLEVEGKLDALLTK